MAKLHILSDLHLEFGDFTPPATQADIVILAGDIHVHGQGLAWAQKHFACPVIYVPGNHEHYAQDLELTSEQLRVQARGTNVHVLNNESVELQGVRFLGTTLWTDYRITGNQALAQWDAMHMMQDFKTIASRTGEPLTPQDLALEHSVSRQFLCDALDKEFAGKTVVVTHHAPSDLSLHERYRLRGSHLNASYASDLSRLMGGERACAWIHGHLHDSAAYALYGTQVVCNPRGYAAHKTNPAFNPGLVIEV